MWISPPFLPTRTHPQIDENWLGTAMDGGTQPGDGFFPVSELNAWHGGTHLRAPAGTNGSVCAVADGTVVYHRSPQAQNPNHALNYHGSASDLRWTDNGVVVLQHALEAGDGDLHSVEIFSIYMHLSQLDSALPEQGQPILRGTRLGRAGSFAGSAGVIHFELVVAPDAFTRLFGRADRLLDTGRAGRTTVVGEIYAMLPVGTQWFQQVSFPPTSAAANSDQPVVPAHGQASTEVAHTSTELMFAGLRYENAACTITLYRENGEVVQSRTEPQGHYGLRDQSAARYPESVGAGYELMRYGRVLGQQALSPATAPHWRQLPMPSGGAGWVNVNADAVRWFSDSDFPHWRGWQRVDDDTGGDVRCDSAIVAELRQAGPSGAASAPTLMPTPPNPQAAQRIRKLACLFPTEWEEGDAAIEQRYGWVKSLPAAGSSPDESFQLFKAFIQAQGFWQAAQLNGLPAVHWHLNPGALIGLLRAPTIWPDLVNRWRTGCTAHVLPVDDDLSAFAKASMYEFALRSSKAAARNHTDEPDTAALLSIDAGRPLIFGMRVETDINAAQGKGLWDDRVVVLKKESTGLTKVAHRGGYTTEPSGRYLQGGQYYASANGSTQNAGGTAHFDAGRLTADRSYEYQPYFRSPFGQSISGTNYNILRKTASSSIDRLVTTTNTLPPNTFVSGANTHWISGTTAAFDEGQSMHFHHGYPNSVTGSAGCQTFPMTAGQTFYDFAEVLKPLQNTSRFQYVLHTM